MSSGPRRGPNTPTGGSPWPWAVPLGCQLRPEVDGLAGPHGGSRTGPGGHLRSASGYSSSGAICRVTFAEQITRVSGPGRLLPHLLASALCGGGASHGVSPAQAPTVPWASAHPALPHAGWLPKRAPWQWAYLLIATDGAAPAPPGPQLSGPQVPNQPILCPELFPRTFVSPKNVPRCEFPWEGTGLAQSILAPCPLPSPCRVGAEHSGCLLGAGAPRPSLGLTLISLTDRA